MVLRSEINRLLDIIGEMDAAGLIFDNSPHYIDHLAPLCALLKWPLIICEGDLADLTRGFYPDLQIVEVPIWEVKLPKMVVTCDSKPFLRAAFPGQETNTLWLPHGNSDKGWNVPFFEAVREDGAALVYGQRMVDFMHVKNVFPKTIRIGNFRWEYSKIKREPDGKKFLYAPTWEDSENNGSFWEAFPDLAKRLPNDCELLVKLHPNTVRKYEPELEVLMGRYQKRNIVFLPQAPPIYPLLAACAAYIGDMSSIGYDFLTFDRPMFFLNAKMNLPLHQCGQAIDPKTFDYSLKDGYSALRRELYNYTFDHAPNWKEEIYALSSV